MTENQVHHEAARHLKIHYPEVPFFSNHEDGRKRHATDAGNIRKLNSGRGRPDVEIFEPRAGFHGLMIELKKDDKQIFKADGVTYKTLHVQEQALMLYTLGCRGYLACFAQGIAQFKQIVDEYMALPKPNYTPPEYDLIPKLPESPEDDGSPF